MNILVNGTSISRGKGSWPYYLQQSIDNSEIVNLAMAGAGNTYIHESTMSEIAQRSYDLVLIQWTYANRIDLRVSNIKQFADSEYTSDFQSRQNDWPDKKIFPINDTEYAQKDWIFGCGYINEKKDDSIARVFKEYYKRSSLNEYTESTLIKIISLQNTLVSLGVPYLFIEYREMTRFDRFDYLYKLINWDRFCYTHLFNIAEDRNALDDTLHPSLECQGIFAEHLYKELCDRKLVNG